MPEMDPIKATFVRQLWIIDQRRGLIGTDNPVMFTDKNEFVAVLMPLCVRVMKFADFAEAARFD